MIDRQELVRRATEYCRRHALELGPQLGYGVHGSVFVVINSANDDRSAIKIHDRDRPYRIERDVYLRLRDVSVTSVGSFAIPEMVRHDDELLAIEMTIVAPPYVLDFAGAYLDREPDYSKEVWDEWRTEKSEQFGANWPMVQSIL
jgi:hypothetical protein